MTAMPMNTMDLFTYMDDEIYQMAISHAKDNPFKKYMEYLKSLGELTLEEEKVYGTIGREFINVIETTNMSKVYKMPVLMAFYNGGNVRLSVTEEQLLEMTEPIGRTWIRSRRTSSTRQ